LALLHLLVCAQVHNIVVAHLHLPRGLNFYRPCGGASVSSAFAALYRVHVRGELRKSSFAQNANEEHAGRIDDIKEPIGRKWLLLFGPLNT